MEGSYQNAESASGSVNSIVTYGSGVTRIEFSSRDQDETRAYLRQYCAEHSRVIHGHGPFLYQLSGWDSGRVLVGRIQRSLPQTLRANVANPTLFLMLEPGETQTYGRQRYELQPDRAMFSAAGHEYTHQGPKKGACIVVRVEGGFFEDAIAARVQRRSRRWLAPSCQIQMPAWRQAEMLSFEAQLQAAAGPRQSWGPYGSREPFERAVAGWLAELVLGVTDVKSVSEQGLARIAKAQRWVDANLEHDITLDQLCAVAGASARSLQIAFMAARGQTPYEFIIARRLEAARKRLESSSSPALVSTVALDCGFRHFGRFSASYRAVFGQLPGETARMRKILRARRQPVKTPSACPP
jgi:AraC-like DNA-binding protein